jgi:hypothetical protein
MSVRVIFACILQKSYRELGVPPTNKMPEVTGSILFVAVGLSAASLLVLCYVCSAAVAP